MTQRTFGDLVGLEPVVPTKTLPSDLIECTDGSICEHQDVFFGVDGKAYPSEEARDEAEVEIVREILQTAEKWVESYTSGEYNNDYGDGYAYIAGECPDVIEARVAEWVDDLDDCFHPYTKRIVESITEQICDAQEWDSVYNSNEYACYSGDGIGIYSLDIGEYEDQIEISAHDALADLDSEGRLENILGQLDGDFCLHRMSTYDDKTKSRIKGKFVSHGCFLVNYAPGGQWHYVVSGDNARLYLANAICQLCRELDGSK